MPHLCAESCRTPPLSLRHLTCGPLRHDNFPETPSSFRPFVLLSSGVLRVRKAGGPPRSIAVNRDPFRHPRFRETFEFRTLFHRRVESPVLGQHGLIIAP